MFQSVSFSKFADQRPAMCTVSRSAEGGPASRMRMLREGLEARRAAMVQPEVPPLVVVNMRAKVYKSVTYPQMMKS